MAVAYLPAFFFKLTLRIFQWALAEIFSRRGYAFVLLNMHVGFLDDAHYHFTPDDCFGFGVAFSRYFYLSQIHWVG